MPSKIVSETKEKKAAWKKVVLYVLVSIMILIGSGFLYEAIASKLAEQDFPMPGKLVDVASGAYQLHIQRTGQGGPVILLESGSGGISTLWGDIPAQLAPFATVVAYDRAGYAWSGKAATERTGANIVQELHEALDKEGIHGPYILVGHSLGGMYARLFAQTYRDETVGLVLLDARHEDYGREAEPIYAQEPRQAMPSAFMLSLLKHSGIMRLFQDSFLEGVAPPEKRSEFINVIGTADYFDAVEEEFRLIGQTEQALRGQKLGNLPVRIIARGVQPDLTSIGFSKEGSRKLDDTWQACQRKMLNLSTDSKLIVASNSGHNISDDEPELVVRVIRELLASVRPKAEAD